MSLSRGTSGLGKLYCALVIFVALAFLVSCDRAQSTSPILQADRSVTDKSAYPLAVDNKLVGTYQSLTKSGAGRFYDDVLEYRVWFYPREGGDDRYVAFAQYEKALAFSRATPDAEEPLVLVRQRQWIDEPEPSHFVPKTGERITEWKVAWLNGSKRTDDGIKEFLKHPRAARN